MTLVLKDLSLSYKGKGTAAMAVLTNLNLEVETGTFVTFIGPSGCGKSSICNLIAGVEKPLQGDILLDGRSILGLPGKVGYMPQKDLLLPWRTLLDNVVLGNDIRRVDKRESRETARHWLERFGLGKFAEYYPHQLSGGMRQRAALLRTFLFGRNTLILDEPFGALDALTRREMQEWLLKVWSQSRPTVVFITHDIEEAILLSDEVVVLSQRPARILKKIPIPFARPRDPDILLASEAISLKKQLLDLLIFPA
ncbi:ABC transporter ATP-binding protein [Desulfosporosinus sp. PR]|uniref:ABC transporter ATP-binding protein n=1 Tax=Candidatus Desulfosporosinus nitrosoreducens TaxID=3401928 RepID=UPI0027F3620C|nr:ABC transporter ATP-binding protein [Desulfosporosinus sp. PR]MDQ7095328.1 ABC transporter ATP-binding protein [Desulfosporosinus sp. PR]